MNRTLFHPIAILSAFLLAVSVTAAPKPRPAPAKPAPPADLKTPPADAETLSSGLVTRRLAEGKGGESPTERDFARVRYSVWRASDGSVVDFTPSTNVTFVALDKLLPGMREMLSMMTPGEKRRGWIASALGGGKIPEGETFVADMELVGVVPQPAAPPDVAAPPLDAKLTRSGLAYKVLRPGTGGVHPHRRSTVVVHYTGWTTDGKMFDSSVIRDEPAAFPLLAVIPGWTEGLQLMTVGEQMRFWIPAALAYKNDPSKPMGMLVFDVELLEIK